MEKCLATARSKPDDFGMAALEEFTGSVAVVVSSCDAFFDAWRPFAHFFRKFWPGCPFPVYLIVNELTLRSDFIRALPVGLDRGWASNMITAVQQLAEPHVLYLQEDYFLNKAVHAAQLASDFSYAVREDVDAFCFRARSRLEPGFQPVNERLGLVPQDSDGRTRCQLTLWKRESFLRVLSAGETAWQMEAQGSERTRDMKVLSYCRRDDAPVPYLMSAIVRGLWTPEALTLCASEGLAITPRFRGVYSSNSLLRRWYRIRTRRALQGALAAARRRPVDLCA